ncbi:MAG: class I SAM-dependent methyltransferase [Pseudomonadota bacterium]
MFLLLNDDIDLLSEHSLMRERVRDAIFPVFDEIGATILVNDREELAALFQQYKEVEDSLIVHVDGANDLRDYGDDAVFKVYLKDFQSIPDTDDSGVYVRSKLQNIPVAEFNQKNCIDIPLWNAPAIAELRRRDSAPVVSLSVVSDNIVFHAGTGRPENTADAQRNGLEFEGVVFSHFITAKSDYRSIARTFIEQFRHNSDAMLRLHLTGDNNDSVSARSVREAMADLVHTAGESACQILVIAASGREGASTFLPTSYFIANDEDDEIYPTVGYFCAAEPLIIARELVDIFGLSTDYALGFDDSESFQTALANAYHIAKTDPNGYAQLRRMSLDSARERFSLERAVKRVREILLKPRYLSALPGIDARRGRERFFINMVGLYDYKKSGWIVAEDQQVGPGFVVGDTDVVVDVGCGDGGYSHFAARYAKELVFCDVNADALATAERRIGETARCPIRGILTTGEQLDIETNYADKVICTEVLEHVDEPSNVTAELFRIGKPGALYLISVPDTLSEKIQIPLAPPQYFEKPNHIRIFERDEFSTLINAAGFEILDHQFRGFHATFEWVLKWFEDHELDYMWAQLWKRALDGKNGMKTKQSMDQYLGKSQTILARKPG